MSKSYRIGIVGFAHMHVNNVAQRFGAHPQAELVACADTVPVIPELRDAPYTRGWNLQHAITDLGVGTSHEDYREMLAKEQLDIAICCSENARHPEVVEACAAAGVHVCVEKPMARSLSDALRMARAAKAGGITLVVNWPVAWSPAERLAKELIDAGEIGRVLEVKWRGGHTGPLGPGATHEGIEQEADAMTAKELAATWWHQVDTGGGAMVDYCCYGSMLARWYIGTQATAAIGMKGNLASGWCGADDNAAMIVRFPGAMGLFEASWTTREHGVAHGPIVYGTAGTLVVEKGAEGQVVRIERGKGETGVYRPDPLPPGRDQIAGEYIHHLETGEPLHPVLERDFNVEVMAILDAGLRSACSGKMETVDNVAWCIG